MNYKDLILCFLLLLMITYADNSSDLDQLKKEIHNTRQEAALMRKELALAREEAARMKHAFVQIKEAAADITP